MSNPEEPRGWEPDSHWEDHPQHLPEDWMNEIANKDTRLSYVDWVNNELAWDRLEAKFHPKKN